MKSDTILISDFVNLISRRNQSQRYLILSLDFRCQLSLKILAIQLGHDLAHMSLDTRIPLQFPFPMWNARI